MTTYLFSNNASATLGSAISPTATSITLAAGTGSEFPSPAAGQFFTATLWAAGSTTGKPNEIVKVTARSGDTMTVVRGQEGTTAQSWNVGDTFANYITAGFLNQLIDTGALQQQSANYAADSGTANAGVVTLVPIPANLAALVGVPIRVKKQGAASTGPYTLNVNSLGNIPVLIGNNTLEGGELAANQVFEVIYNGAQFNLISNPNQVHGDRLTGGSVQNEALAPVGADTVKGNLTGVTGEPYDIPLATLAAALGAYLDPANVEVVGGVYVVRIGGMLIQLGNTVVNSNVAGVTSTSTFGVPFNNVPFVFISAIDPSTAQMYNQKIFRVATKSTTNFTARIKDDDSGNAGSYIYNYDWIAISPLG